MTEGRCASCEFWKNVGPSPHQRDMVCGDCCSEEALACIGGYFLSTTPRFGCPLWQRREPDLREQLAEYAHDAWSGWMVHLFGRTRRCTNGEVIIDSGDADRWMRQCKTKYEKLPESEKASDLAEADKMIAIFNQHQSKS